MPNSETMNVDALEQKLDEVIKLVRDNPYDSRIINRLFSVKAALEGVEYDSFVETKNNIVTGLSVKEILADQFYYESSGTRLKSIVMETILQKATEDELAELFLTGRLNKQAWEETLKIPHSESFWLKFVAEFNKPRSLFHNTVERYLFGEFFAEVMDRIVTTENQIEAVETYIKTQTTTKIHQTYGKGWYSVATELVNLNRETVLYFIENESVQTGSRHFFWAHPSLTIEDLEKEYETARTATTPDTLTYLISNPNSSTEFLEKIWEQETMNLRLVRAFLDNNSTPPWILGTIYAEQTILDSTNTRLLQLAGNSNTPVDVLTALSVTPAAKGQKLRIKLAGNPATPLTLLRKLSHSLIPQIAEAAEKTIRENH